MLPLIIFLTEIIILYILSKKLLSSFQIFLFKILKNKKRAIYAFAFLFLPGTIIHELSHWIVAMLLIVRAGKITVLPKIIEHDDGKTEIHLGSVQIAKVDQFRRLIIGAAPFFLGISIILFSISYANSNQLLGNFKVILLISYLSFEIGNTMFSSKKDLEGAWKVGLLLVIIYIASYLLGIRISISQNSILSDEVLELIKKANLYLLVPIGIDLLLLSIPKVIRK